MLFLKMIKVEYVLIDQGSKRQAFASQKTFTFTFTLFSLFFVLWALAVLDVCDCCSCFSF
jgi:hypothetical protein